MNKGRGPFGGGDFPGGSKPLEGGNSPGGSTPFGSGGSSPSEFPKDLPLGPREMHVVPGSDRPNPSDRIEQRGVIPGAGGHIAPRDVIPQEGAKQPDVIASSGENLQPVVHVVIFARHGRPEGEQLIKDLDYLHAASDKDFHLVLAGYSYEKPAESLERLSDPRAIPIAGGASWYYDDGGFLDQVRMIENATTWKYQGGLQLLICDVMVPGGRAVSTRQIFVEGRGVLDHVIVIDVDELTDKKLFADFERFFGALRILITDIRSKETERVTWHLSDRLALTQGGVTLRSVAKAFKLDFEDAFDSAISLKNFAVRDIRRKR